MKRYGRYAERIVFAVLLVSGTGCSSSSSTSDLTAKTIVVDGSDSGGADVGAATTNDGAAEAADATTEDGAAADSGGGALDAGADGEGMDATVGDAGLAADVNFAADVNADAPFVPPTVTPICSPTATWSQGTLLAVSTDDDDTLTAITPDELTIVWRSGSVGSGVFLYADRASSSDPFGSPQTVASGSFTIDRAAVSADGLRLTVVTSDGQGFLEMTRTDRNATTAFGAAAAGPYTNLNGALASGESYGDPVLSSDDHSFYYSVYGGASASVHRSERIFEGDAWPTGAPLSTASALAAVGTMYRRPSGIASDTFTLFYEDEVDGGEFEAFVSTQSGVFDDFVSLGGQAWSAPNTACTRLYYSAQGAASLDLFVASD